MAKSFREHVRRLFSRQSEQSVTSDPPADFSDDDPFGGTQIHYQGRRWDAPVTDGALKVEYMTGETCIMCSEKIGPDDDAILNTWARQPHHLECYIVGPLGDVQHLERRCLCFRGKGNEITYPSDHYETSRQRAQAALQWIVDHGQGRFHDE